MTCASCEEAAKTTKTEVCGTCILVEVIAIAIILIVMFFVYKQVTK